MSDISYRQDPDRDDELYAEIAELRSRSEALGLFAWVLAAAGLAVSSFANFTTMRSLLIAGVGLSLSAAVPFIRGEWLERKADKLEADDRRLRRRDGDG